MISPIELMVTLGFILMSATVDAEHLSKNHFIDNHRSRWLLRLSFFLALGCSNWMFFFGSALLFTALFDQVLNSLRGFPFWYLGSVAKWDIFFKKRMWLYKIVKVLSLLIGILLYLIKI